MSKEENPPIDQNLEKSKIPAKTETVSQEPQRENRELLEKPPAKKSEESITARIREIRESLQKPTVHNDVIPSDNKELMDNPTLEVRNVHRFYKWFAKWYDRTRKIWNPFFPASTEKGFNELLSRYVEDGAEILDIGVGTGINIERVLKHNITFGSYEGIDVTPQMLDVAKDKFNHVKNLRLLLGDITQMEITKKYDTIISTLALCHLREPDKTIQKLSVALKPGGKFLYLDYFDVPNPRLHDKVASWVYRRMFHFSPISIETAEKFPVYNEEQHYPFLGGQLSMYVFQKNPDE